MQSNCKKSYYNSAAVNKIALLVSHDRHRNGASCDAHYPIAFGGGIVCRNTSPGSLFKGLYKPLLIATPALYLCGYLHHLRAVTVFLPHLSARGKYRHEIRFGEHAYFFDIGSLGNCFKNFGTVHLSTAFHNVFVCLYPLPQTI